MARLVSRFIALVAAVAILAVPLTFLATLFTATEASATGNCQGSIGGANLDDASTPGHAINLKEHSSVPVTGLNSADLGSLSLLYKIQMQFYLLGSRVSWTIASGETSGHYWSTTVNVDKYAKYGTGLYLLHAISYGTGGQKPCSVDGFVNISPSGISDAEIGGIVLGGLGLASAAGAGLVAASEGRKLSDVTQLADEASATGDSEMSTFMLERCGFFSLLAFALTLGAMGWDLARALGSHIKGIVS